MSTLNEYLYSDYAHLDDFELPKVKRSKTKPLSVNQPTKADIALASAKRYLVRGETDKALTILDDALVDLGDERIDSLYNEIMEMVTMR